MTNDCPHEDNITYGKSIDVTPTLTAVHIICEECGAVGTQIEEQDTDTPDHWQPIDEMWHEPRDYYNDALAQDIKIGRNRE